MGFAKQQMMENDDRDAAARSLIGDLGLSGYCEAHDQVLDDYSFDEEEARKKLAGMRDDPRVDQFDSVDQLIATMREIIGESPSSCGFPAHYD